MGIFFHDSALIQEIITKKTTDKGKRHSRLYYLDGQQIMMVNLASLELWHERFGHLSNHKLDSIKTQLFVKDSCNVPTLPCIVCPLAKQRQLPFVSYNHMSNKTFDLIHFDIWGPYSTPSHSDHRYVVTIVDDNTRFTWVFLIKKQV